MIHYLLTHESVASEIGGLRHNLSASSQDSDLTQKKRPPESRRAFRVLKKDG